MRKNSEERLRKGWPVLRVAGFALTFADLLTFLNLLSGLLAIFAVLNDEILVALLLVLAGALFDFFDGRFARAYGGEGSDFGRELDSLADIVTFGVAPVVILTLSIGGAAMMICGALYLVAAAARLARFNITKTKGFRGLPVPAAALILLAVFALFTFGITVSAIVFLWLFPLLFLLLALLMLSTIRIPKP